jgi:hypothetical protein
MNNADLSSGKYLFDFFGNDLHSVIETREENIVEWDGDDILLILTKGRQIAFPIGRSQCISDFNLAELYLNYVIHSPTICSISLHGSCYFNKYSAE